MKISSLVMVLFLSLITTICTLGQQSRQYYLVNRVFANINSYTVGNARTRQLAPILQFWERKCENQFPTVVNIPTHVSSSGTICETSYPLSIFARPTLSNCSVLACSVYDINAGGGLGGGFDGNQAAAPGSGSLPTISHQYVSITTYSAQESSPGNTLFPMGVEQTNILYCPGSAAITSTFLFLSGACVLTPNITTNISNIKDTDWNSSMRIFTNYKAFYALCGNNGGLLIKGCEDENCQNCFVITNYTGCVQYLPDALTGYINYQGCGMNLTNTTI